jgi:hypothetical protein
MLKQLVATGQHLFFKTDADKTGHYNSQSEPPGISPLNKY